MALIPPLLEIIYMYAYPLYKILLKFKINRTYTIRRIGGPSWIADNDSGYDDGFVTDEALYETLTLKRKKKDTFKILFKKRYTAGCRKWDGVEDFFYQEVHILSPLELCIFFEKERKDNEFIEYVYSKIIEDDLNQHIMY